MYGIYTMFAKRFSKSFLFFSFSLDFLTPLFFQVSHKAFLIFPSIPGFFLQNKSSHKFLMHANILFSFHNLQLVLNKSLFLASLYYLFPACRHWKLPD